MALEPHETLFESGDASDAGIYIVVEGALGVFLAGADGGARHTNTLHPGESVGDLDVLDGALQVCTSCYIHIGNVCAAFSSNTISSVGLCGCCASVCFVVMQGSKRNLTFMAWEECAGGCTSRT